jgi:ABC-2 type transport system ATP-binding protein
MGRDGTTILLTTHYMDEARRCARVGLMRRGRLLAEGTPAQIMASAGVDNLEDAFLKLAGRRAEADA